MKKRDIVFAPYAEMSEEEILEKLEKARNSVEHENYRSVDQVISDLRGKYGL